MAEPLPPLYRIVGRSEDVLFETDHIELAAAEFGALRSGPMPLECRVQQSIAVYRFGWRRGFRYVDVTRIR